MYMSHIPFGGPPRWVEEEKQKRGGVLKRTEEQEAEEEGEEAEEKEEAEE